MTDFSPTTEEVREAYILHMREAGVATAHEHGVEFDRWLARSASDEAVDTIRAVVTKPAPATYVRVDVQVREGEELVGHCTHEYELQPGLSREHVIEDLRHAATFCGRSALFGDPLIIVDADAEGVSS